MKHNDKVKGIVEVKRVEDNRIDEVIGEIFKIESTALGIQSDTEREKQEYAELTERRIKEFDEQLSVETSKKIENLREQLKAEKENKMLSMRDDISSYTLKMEKLYMEKHEEWVKNIVDNIIKE